MTPKRKQEIGYLLNDIRKEFEKERKELNIEKSPGDYNAHQIENVEKLILELQTEIELNKNL